MVLMLLIPGLHFERLWPWLSWLAGAMNRGKRMQPTLGVSNSLKNSYITVDNHSQYYCLSKYTNEMNISTSMLREIMIMH